MSDRDTTDLPETVEALPTAFASTECSSRASWIEALWPEGEVSLESAIAGVLDQGLGIAQVNRLTLMGGSCNDCPVPRLIRVRLDGESATMLAEPTSRAVIEAGLSLLRAKGVA